MDSVFMFLQIRLRYGKDEFLITQLPHLFALFLNESPIAMKVGQGMMCLFYIKDRQFGIVDTGDMGEAALWVCSIICPFDHNFSWSLNLNYTSWSFNFLHVFWTVSTLFVNIHKIVSRKTAPFFRTNATSKNYWRDLCLWSDEMINESKPKRRKSKAII